jgi:hypothetical protein
MKSKHLFAIVLAAAGLARATGMAAESTNQPASVSTHMLRVVVDPRVELMSLIFRLADNREYNMAKVESYADDADKQFGKFRGHMVVNLARQARESQGVSFDAVMSMAIHLTDAEHPALKLPLEPWPDGLDKRWTASHPGDFLAAGQQFVEDSSFPEFIEKHRPLYDTTVTRMQALLNKEAHLEWFDAYFGRGQQASFTVALVNGAVNGIVIECCIASATCCKYDNTIN